MLTNESEAMTVEELIEALRGYDADTPVFYREPMGRLTGLVSISDLSPMQARFNDELSMFVVVHDGEPVIVLE